MGTESFRYTAKQVQFLRRAYASMAIRDLTPKFNAAFGLQKTPGQIRSAMKNHSITCGRRGNDRIFPARAIDYTPGQLAFLREHYRTMTEKELTVAFNAHFGLNKPQSAIGGCLANHKILSGRTGRFQKGQASWNKGLRGYMGPNATSFKKGDIPPTRKPLGAERIYSKDGFILVKIAERNPYTGAGTRYKHKHVHIWETIHGPVPKDHVVAFKDANKLNCDPDNLMLLSRRELLSLNLHGYKEQPAELKPTVLLLAKLEAKAGVRTRPARGRVINDRLSR